MFDRIPRYWYECAKRTSPRYIVAFIACMLLAFVWSSPVGHVQAAHAPAKGAEAPLSGDTFKMNSLRNEAASGNELSNLELTNALLDRYDLTGNSDDLYEALEWVDRRLDGSHDAELAGRSVERYCNQRVAQWHRICIQAE